MGPVSVPSAIRVTSTDLAVFTCGRSATPCSVSRVRRRAQLAATLARSRISAGVSMR